MEPQVTNVARTPNPLYTGADADRSILTNPMYGDVATTLGQPDSSSSESRIDGRIKEQRLSRHLLGVGIMSALALLLAIVAIATNGGGRGGGASGADTAVSLFS